MKNQENEIPEALKDKTLSDRILDYLIDHKEITHKNMCTKKGIEYLAKKYPFKGHSFRFCVEFEFEGRQYSCSGIDPFLSNIIIDNQGGLVLKDIETGMISSYHVYYDQESNENMRKL